MNSVFKYISVAGIGASVALIIVILMMNKCSDSPARFATDVAGRKITIETRQDTTIRVPGVAIDSILSDDRRVKLPSGADTNRVADLIIERQYIDSQLDSLGADIISQFQKSDSIATVTLIVGEVSRTFSLRVNHAPLAVEYVKTQEFALNSGADEWQLWTLAGVGLVVGILIGLLI